MSLIFLISCNNLNYNDQLKNIAAKASSRPKEALSLLDNINPLELSESDRHYYDLLLVKVNDKNYITHKSDSLILNIIEYYSANGDNDLLPEALYYGGRVYSDLGDYPTAVGFFHNCLELLPSNTSNLELRGNVLSQTARLLNTLRLYDQALPYLREVIHIDSISNDYTNLFYDIQLLGAINLHAQNYDYAELCFKKAWILANQVSPQDTLQTKIYLAAIKHKQNDLDSALLLIKDIPNKINPLSRNLALAYAAIIHLDCGNIDSAYYYALDLIKNDNPNNKKTGYQILLSDKLRPLIPSDSIGFYFNDYSHILETYFDQNQTECSLLQNSYYNYQVHVRERKKAEDQKSNLIKLIYVITIIPLGLFILILILKNRQKSQLLQLREALDNIEHLHRLLQSKGNEDIVISENKNYIEKYFSNKQDTTELKNRLRKELLDLRQSHQPEVSLKIINSEAYKKLQSYITQEKIITEKNPLWKELETIVLEESPHFKDHLVLLTGENLKDSAYHIALLIKCGISPTQMTTLIGKTKGTISYQRGQLCLKVIGEKLGAKTADDIIRLL